MPLTYDLTKVQNFEDVCFVGPVIKGTTERKWNPVTESLIFATLEVGIGEITNDNWQEFYRRLRISEKVSGPYLINVAETDQTRLITPKEVKQHIGLKTNAYYKPLAIGTLYKRLRDHITIPKELL